MSVEHVKPIPVRGPDQGRIRFALRLVVDLQLLVISKFLRRVLPSLSGQILDIGAGESPWRSWLGSSVQYQGVDIESAEEFGMKRQRDVVYYDGRVLPFAEESFDGALCIEVLEHASDPHQLLREALRVLRPGSPFILTVPWSARRHYVPNDFHRFTREQIIRMFSQVGFVDLDVVEGGNDVCVVANKLIIIGWRLLTPRKSADVLWTLPLAILELPLAALALVCAHVSLLMNLGSLDDPLGYSILCFKKLNVPDSLSAS